MGEHVDLSGRTAVPGTSTRLRGYVARPLDTGAVAGRWCVVHEAWGLDDVARRQADRLAAAGYLVLLPDLYSDGGALRCLKATFAALKAQRGRPFQDIEASRAWLAGQGECTGRVGVIGFCMGGGFALLAATQGVPGVPRSTTACCPRTRTRRSRAPARSSAARRQGPRAQGRRGGAGRDAELAGCRARRQGVPHGQPLRSSTTPPTGRWCSVRCSRSPASGLTRSPPPTPGSGSRASSPGTSAARTGDAAATRPGGEAVPVTASRRLPPGPRPPRRDREDTLRLTTDSRAPHRTPPRAGPRR